MDEFDKYFTKQNEEDEFSKYFPKPQPEQQDEYSKYFIQTPSQPSPGSPEYAQKVQQGIQAYEGEPEIPIDPHPIEDPVNLALMTAVPLSLGGGLVRTAVSGAGIGAGITQAQSLLNEGKPASLTETAIGAGVGAVLPTGLKVAGEVARPVVSKVAGAFSGKIKQLAKFRGISPQQVNKELHGAVKAGQYANRGEALDDMARAYFNVPEKPPVATPITEKVSEQLMQPIGKGEYPGLPNLEGRVTQETAEKMVSDIPVTEPRFDQYGNRITGQTLNLSKLSPDDRVLQQQIDNMVNMFPDESALPTYQAVEDFKRVAADMPGSAADDFFRNGYDQRFPQQQLRNLALRNRVAENLFIGHTGEVTSKLAQRVKDGDLTVLESFKSALETDLKLAQSTGAFRSELGRGLRMLKEPNEAFSPGAKFIQDTTRLLQKMGKDQKFTDEIARKMASVDVMDPRQRLEFFRSLIQPSNWDRISEIWYNSILSGVKTQARNILGNVGAMVYRETEKPIVGGLDLARSVITGKPREAFVRESLAGWTGQTGGQFIRDPLHGVYSIAGGFADAVKAGYKAFVTELPQSYDVSINELIGSGKFTGGVIRGTKGRIIRVPSRGMMAFDEFFKALHNRIGINSFAYREARKIQAAERLSQEQFDDLFMAIKSQPDEVLRKMVKDETLYRVFQNDPGRIVNGFLRFKNSHPILNALFPFIRTPANIGFFTLERLPGPSLAYIISSARKGSALAIEESIAKALTGGATAIGVYELYKHGLIRGSQVDPRKRGMAKGLLTAGEQPYSFVSPDGQTSYSFLNFTPLSGILGYMADGFTAMENHPILSQDFFGQLMSSAFNQLGMQSYMGNWSTIFNDIGQGNYGKGLANTLAQASSGLIPFSSFMRSVAMGGDPTLRTPFENQDFMDKYVDYLKLNIPGLRPDVMPVMDVWGNDVVTSDGVAARILESVGIDPGPGATMVDGIGNPVRIQEASKDPVNIELARLIHTLGPEESFRGLDSPRIKGSALEGINLTQDEYIAYVKASGRMAHDAIADGINKPWYIAAPNSVKIRFYEKMISRAREITKAQMFGKKIYERKKGKALTQEFGN